MCLGNSGWRWSIFGVNEIFQYLAIIMFLLGCLFGRWKHDLAAQGYDD